VEAGLATEYATQGKDWRHCGDEYGYLVGPT
jgi:hypothetical protein